MEVAFIKMHGAGNDFVVVDERATPLALPPGRIAELADRRRGIGFDQLVRLQAPRDPAAAVRMRIDNADGSESAACGNATRCVAALATAGRPGPVTVETATGLLACIVLAPDRVEVDMGAPNLDAASLGIERAQVDTLHLPLEGDPAGCSIGNPHATFFVDDPDAIDLERVGPAIEHDPLFAARANIGFARVVAPGTLRLRVWERGAGRTLACGTGACAALVNAHRRGLTGRAARVVMDGGTLEIEWREADDRVRMTGPVAIAFEGRFAP